MVDLLIDTVLMIVFLPLTFLFPIFDIHSSLIYKP